MPARRRKSTGGRHVLRATTIDQDSRTQRSRARGQDERRAVQGQLQELEDDLDATVEEILDATDRGREDGEDE